MRTMISAKQQIYPEGSPRCSVQINAYLSHQSRSCSSSSCARLSRFVCKGLYHLILVMVAQIIENLVYVHYLIHISFAKLQLFYYIFFYFGLYLAFYVCSPSLYHIGISLILLQMSSHRTNATLYLALVMAT